MKKNSKIILAIFLFVSVLSLAANFIRWDETPLEQSIFALPLGLGLLLEMPFLTIMGFFVKDGNINYQLLWIIIPFVTGAFYSGIYYLVMKLNKKLRIKPLFILSSIFLVFIIMGIFRGETSDSNSKFAVYLTDTNLEVFSEDDLISYNPVKSQFKFTEAGAEKMKAYQTTTYINGGLYQKSFVAKLGDEELYSGKFWTNLSSSSYPGIVISDVFMISPEYNTLTVASQYPGDTNLENDELIKDKRIIEHFKEINKL